MFCLEQKLLVADNGFIANNDLSSKLQLMTEDSDMLAKVVTANKTVVRHFEFLLKQEKLISQCLGGIPNTSSKTSVTDKSS